ncbi:MAG: type II secretion system GspH family protein [Candidatus Roizmanbacteria bacterium]|nr:type II secretion system GspH family protein [Candidatus Roizmanbacteria bacterium]
MKKYLHNGFTLIEMLVVLSVIGVLIGIGTVSFSAAQRNAQDAKRREDVAFIQKSLEQYYSICGNTYPTAFGGASVQPPVYCTQPTVIIATNIPVDPRSATPYVYTLNSNEYTICATLQNSSQYCLNNQQ